VISLPSVWKTAAATWSPLLRRAIAADVAVCQRPDHQFTASSTGGTELVIAGDGGGSDLEGRFDGQFSEAFDHFRLIDSESFGGSRGNRGAKVRGVPEQCFVEQARIGVFDGFQRCAAGQHEAAVRRDGEGSGAEIGEQARFFATDAIRVGEGVPDGDDAEVFGGEEQIAVGGKESQGDDIGFMTFLKFAAGSVSLPATSQRIGAIADVFDRLECGCIEHSGIQFPGPHENSGTVGTEFGGIQPRGRPCGNLLLTGGSGILWLKRECGQDRGAKGVDLAVGKCGGEW
jgi:hypothetical protein